MADWLSRIDATHDLLWAGTGSGGSWTYRVARDPGGFRFTEVLENDADPLGPAAPVTTTKVLDGAAATAEIAEQVEQNGEPSVTTRR
jgi:hypothetical protein